MHTSIADNHFINCDHTRFKFTDVYLYLTCREFVKICDTGVNLNGRLVNMDQLEYQENLRKNFRDMAERLSEIFDEYVSTCGSCSQLYCKVVVSLVCGCMFLEFRGLVLHLDV